MNGKAGDTIVDCRKPVEGVLDAMGRDRAYGVNRRSVDDPAGIENVMGTPVK